MLFVDATQECALRLWHYNIVTTAFTKFQCVCVCVCGAKCYRSANIIIALL